VKDAVKESLKKAVGMRATLEQTVTTLKELRAQAKEISEEQARLRTNMEKLPPTSELYKRYLSKLDQAETGLERLQSEVKEKEADERKRKKEYDGFLEKLNVE
jgi:DNA repair exonuclease SbcCD ATPase subunit